MGALHEQLFWAMSVRPFLYHVSFFGVPSRPLDLDGRTALQELTRDATCRKMTPASMAKVLKVHLLGRYFLAR